MSGIDEKPQSLKNKKEDEVFSLEREWEKRILDRILLEMQAFIRMYESPDPQLAGLLNGRVLPAPPDLVRARTWLNYRRRMLRHVRDR